MLKTRKISNATLFIILTLTIYYILERSDTITSNDIESSIKYSQLYLRDVYDVRDVYRDPAIQCICNYTCNQFFKKIDASVNLIWIGNEVEDYGLIDYQIKNADEFLKNQTELFEELPLYNDGIFVGDLSCIFASIYNNTKITEKVEALAKPYGWTEISAFDEENSFQKTMYESWCIILLAERGSNKSTVLSISEQVLSETLLIIQNPRISTLSKTYAAVFTLTVFKKLEKNGYRADTYASYLKTLQDYIAIAANEESLIDDTNAQSLILYVLSDYNYSHAETKKIALRLLARQDSDGGWQLHIDEKSNFGKAFTTLRVILALNRYELVYLSE